MKNLQELINVHIPVMSAQVLEYLNLQPGGLYIDGTIGAGGHAAQILSKLSNEGKLIGIDRDAEALEICYERFSAFADQISLHHSSYHNLSKIMGVNGLSKANGILLDLGISSLQINSEDRGFSFQSNALADMRFDQTKGQTAKDLIRKSSEKELADIIYQFGEERKSRRISNSIKKIKNLSTTMDLKEAIRKSTPPHHRNKTHARVFQAIRIAVNDEIDKLKIKSILNSLDFKINTVNDISAGVTIPQYRHDVNRECDVVEEILRIHGYNNIPIDKNVKFSISSLLNKTHKYQNIISDYLSSIGFNEIMNNSCLLYTSPSPRDGLLSRMPSSA